jgi:hypothetical protein
MIEIPRYSSYTTDSGINGYKICQKFSYKSYRYAKAVIINEGTISDGATGAFDIISAGWWVHDELCKTGHWSDGTKCTNLQASTVLHDILKSEGRWFRAKTWFIMTFLFGGGVCRKNGMFKLTAVLVFLLAGLSGCGYMGFDDYAQYSQAYQVYAVNDSKRLETQVVSIQKSASEAMKTASPDARPLIAVLAMLQINSLAHGQFSLQKPATGLDAVNKLVDHGPVLAGFGAIWKVVDTVADKIGDTNVNTQGGNVTDSFNPVEVHATGSGNNVSFQGVSDPTVVKPEIVEVTGEQVHQ